MRYALVLFIVGAGVLHGVAKADSVGCYQFGNITQCSNGVSAYQFGNITQIQTPQQPIPTPAIQPIQPMLPAPAYPTNPTSTYQPYQPYQPFGK